jgi:hypothetical protein
MKRGLGTENREEARDARVLDLVGAIRIAAVAAERGGKSE